MNRRSAERSRRSQVAKAAKKYKVSVTLLTWRSWRPWRFNYIPRSNGGIIVSGYVDSELQCPAARHVGHRSRETVLGVAILGGVLVRISRWKLQRRRRSSIKRHATRLPLHRRRLRLEPLEDRRLLATVTVNTELDTVDFNDGLTSLREAIFATNLVAGPDTIDFDFAHDGPATIVLTQGELRITDHLTINGASAELLTIDASGNDPTPDENNGDGTRLLNIDDGDTAALIDVRVSGVTLTGGDTSGPGGAIRTRENLTILSSVITGNNTRGLPGTGGGGVSSGVGHLNIVGSTISHNSARSSGGGINGISGKITLSHSNIHANQTRISGGGLHFSYTEVNVLDSSVSGNYAEIGVGGGIASDRGSLLIRFSHVSENTVGGLGLATGGGISNGNTPMMIAGSSITNNSAARGAGIWNVARDEISTISNSTISGNDANGAGGGIYNRSGQLVVQFSTITGNTAPSGFGSGLASYGMNYAPTRVHSSIVAGNTNSDLDFVGFANSFQSMGFNLVGFGNATSRFNGPGDVSGIANPSLSPLANNGGPTPTHALLSGSPAINAGDLNAQAGVDGVPFYDQRGEPFSRVFNGRSDIGSFEFQDASDLNLLVDTLADELDDNHGRGDLSLREAIELANMWPSNDTIRFDPALVATGPATILLKQGELRITDDVSIEGLGTEQLTVDASGNDPTPDEDNGDGSRIFNVNDNELNNQLDVRLNDLRLTGAANAIFSSEKLTLDQLIITGNGGRAFGGAIFQAYGEFTLRNSTITNNRADRGGGIHLRESQAIIENSRISGNIAGGAGGGVYIYRGQLNVTNVEITENTAGSSGGGIHLENCETLTIAGSEISNNSLTAVVSDGGGIQISGLLTAQISNTNINHNSARLHGGGIHLERTYDRPIELKNVSFIGNTAGKRGGGVYAEYARLHITNSNFTENTAVVAGGGAYFEAGQQTFEDSAFIGNTAPDGGGLWYVGSSVSSMMLIERTSFQNNVATDSGGGMHLNGGNVQIIESLISGNRAGGNGGGIARYNSPTSGETLTENVTISFNRAETNGGGVFIQSSAGVPVELAHSTIYENSSDSDFSGGGSGGGVFLARGTAILDHTIVAHNSDNSRIGHDLTGFIGAQFAPRFSLIGTNQGSGLNSTPFGMPDANGNLIGDLIGISPALGVNAGDPAARPGVDGVPLYDQRGAPFTRVYDGRIDIGAFELQPTEFILGDNDRDSIVTAADYVLWRKAHGMSDGLGFRVDQRGNSDGIVDDWDYDLWRANFGRRHTMSEPQAATSQTMDANPRALEQAAVRQESSSSGTAPDGRTHASHVGRTAFFAPPRRDALSAWLLQSGVARTRTRDDAVNMGASRPAADEPLTSAEAFDEALATLADFSATSRFSL
jgi:CSLREA domain-containing protein